MATSYKMGSLLETVRHTTEQAVYGRCECVAQHTWLPHDSEAQHTWLPHDSEAQHTWLPHDSEAQHTWLPHDSEAQHTWLPHDSEAQHTWLPHDSEYVLSAVWTMAYTTWPSPTSPWRRVDTTGWKPAPSTTSSSPTQKSETQVGYVWGGWWWW